MTLPERLPETEMEIVFLEALPQIDAVIETVGRRQGLKADEIADFGSSVKLSMVQSSYRILARFEGRSSLKTYLLTVIRRQLIDYRRSVHGKWRPSSCASRLGPAAVQMERLVFRDGLTVTEAANVCSSDADDATNRALIEMTRALPTRRRVTVKSIEDTQASDLKDPSPDPRHATWISGISRRLQEALNRAIEDFSPQDRELIRLRFERGLGAIEIGRALGLTPRRVYARCDALLARLRVTFLEEGMAWSDVARTAESSDWTFQWPVEAPKPPSTTSTGELPTV
ncbi:MAG: sigma-70 family RNA polymerase sigma factor [Vicinamibacteria bacterium]